MVSKVPPGSPDSLKQPPGSPRQPPSSPLHPLGSPRHPLNPPGPAKTHGPVQPHDQPNRPNENKESPFLENTSKDTATQKAELAEDELVIIFKIC